MENKGSRNGRGYATEKANFITLMVVLHEEGVAIDDVLVQVPRKLLVESPGNRVDEGGEYARLVVGPEAGLRSIGTLSWGFQWGDGSRGGIMGDGGRTTYLVIAHLRLRTILPENSEKSHYIGILRDVSVSRINDASESGLEEGVTAQRRTRLPNSIPNPSKQRMIVRGL